MDSYAFMTYVQCNIFGVASYLPAQSQACEVMEVFDELLETEVSIIVQHLSEVVGFCLEVNMMCILCSPFWLETGLKS